MSSEATIIEKLRRIPSEEGFKKLADLKSVQLSFLANSIFKTEFTPSAFRACIKEIFQRVLMFSNKESLEPLPDGLIVITNHLGLNKLTKIYPSEILQELPHEFVLELPRLENDDPFVLLLAPITEYLSSQFDTSGEFAIIYVFMKLEPVFENILQRINAVTVERDKPNQYPKLKQDIETKVYELKKQHKKPLIVIFPEGGTSGKSNSADPYQLLEFKKGYRLLAKDLNLPILPVAVKFDSDINIHINAGKLLESENTTLQDRNSLQKLLNETVSSKLILISGYDRSGKSTAANIAVDYGYLPFECGAFVKAQSESSQKIAISKLYEEKMDEFNTSIVSSIIQKCSTNEKLAVIGVRSIALLHSLKGAFPDLKLIFIESDQGLRFKRHLSQSTQIESLDAWSTFQSVDHMQDEWGLESIKLIADYVVLNNETSATFEQNVKRILGNL